MTATPQGKANISLVVEALYAVAAEPDRWDQLVEALGGASPDGAAQADGAARFAGPVPERADPAAATQAGVVLIGPSGGAIAWNAGGAAAFQQRLGLVEARGLRFFNPANHEALDAARRRLREAAGGQVIVKFNQADDEAPHFAYVIPARALPVALAADLPPVGELGEGVVAVLFPAVETTDRLWATMRDSFGLTPAETRVAVRLKDGLTLKEAADDLAISVNTVRNQLRAVFDKMGLNRQSELVRALTQLGSLSDAFGQEAPAVAISATERGALATAPPIRFFQLSDGRRLAWRDYGDSQGRPVLVFHQGLGCSILPRGSDVLARDLGLRLIAPERPGAGRSDPRPDFTIQGVGRDMAELAAGLRLGRVRIAAFMSGAAFALMAAAELGAGVDRVLLASVRPSGQMVETEHDAAHPGVLFRRRILRNAWLADTLFALMRMQLNRRGIERFVRAAASAPSDAAYLAAHPGVMDFIVDYIGESLAVTHRGIADEVRCAARSPDLDLSGLSAPISVWHGADDVMTSVDQVKAWLGERAGETRVFPGTGHFLPHKHWPEVLGWLAEE